MTTTTAPAALRTADYLGHAACWFRPEDIAAAAAVAFVRDGHEVVTFLLPAGANPRPLASVREVDGTTHEDWADRVHLATGGQCAPSGESHQLGRLTVVPVTATGFTCSLCEGREAYVLHGDD